MESKSNESSMRTFICVVSIVIIAIGSGILLNIATSLPV